MKALSRRVFIETLSSLEATARWRISNEIFCLVVIADLESIPADIQRVGEFAAAAMLAGARLIISHGSAADLIHDIFDEVIAIQKASNNSASKPEDEVLTVSLGSRPLLDALKEIFEVYRLPDGPEASDAPIVFALIEGDPRMETVSEFVQRSEKEVKP